MIIGAKHIDQLDDNIVATKMRLDDVKLAGPGIVSALPDEYPGWMLERQSEFRRRQLADAVTR